MVIPKWELNYLLRWITEICIGKLFEIGIPIRTFAEMTYRFRIKFYVMFTVRFKFILFEPNCR